MQLEEPGGPLKGNDRALVTHRRTYGRRLLSLAIIVGVVAAVVLTGLAIPIARERVSLGLDYYADSVPQVLSVPVGAHVTISWEPQGGWHSEPGVFAMWTGPFRACSPDLPWECTLFYAGIPSSGSYSFVAQNVSYSVGTFTGCPGCLHGNSPGQTPPIVANLTVDASWPLI